MKVRTKGGAVARTITINERGADVCGVRGRRTLCGGGACRSSRVATSVGANRIDLAWTVAQSVSHYEVQRKSGAAGYALVATPAGTSPSV